MMDDILEKLEAKRKNEDLLKEFKLKYANTEIKDSDLEDLYNSMTYFKNIKIKNS